MHYQENGSIVLTQTKYVKDLLAKINKVEAKGVNTPMFSSCKLSKHRDDKMSYPFLYKSKLEALQYVTLTRPDIVFCVNKAYQYMSDPLDPHWGAVKCMMRYLNDMITHALVLTHATTQQQMSLHAYSDSYWASDPDDRRSTSGPCVYLGPNLVVWSSKKKSLESCSNTEAEYKALTHTTSEILWF